MPVIHWQAQAGSLSELVEPLLLLVVLVARDILATPRPSGWHLPVTVMYVYVALTCQ